MDADTAFAPAALLARHRRARERRRAWESHWAECFDLTLPQRGALLRAPARPGEKRTDRLFDGTAPDAVDQLAAALLAQLAPAGARWVSLTAGAEAPEEGRGALGEELERASATLQSHFDRSNFTVEAHQCLLDAVIAGTACLLFEEAAVGETSAFRFAAVPLVEAVLEEGPSGRLDVTWRSHCLPAETAAARFGPSAVADLPPPAEGGETRLDVLEAVLPEPGGYRYVAMTGGTEPQGARVLASGRFATSPFVNFRWLKAPGEIYGRSPVMKALPDIKTANKVVELVLKNASIAVTGIWQADDDGVLNPATIRLVPGTIIPKAVGSAGLTPLQAPGRFDVSQLVLDDLRARIRHALYADRLGQVQAPRMTATEVLERSAEMARLLAATYGRLQAELLTPLVLRAHAILRRRGEVPDREIDGRTVTLRFLSPLAQGQGRADVQGTLTWLAAVREMGPDGIAAVDLGAAARWLGRSLGVPEVLIRPDVPEQADDPAALLAGLAALAGGEAPDA